MTQTGHTGVAGDARVAAHAYSIKICGVFNNNFNIRRSVPVLWFDPTARYTYYEQENYYNDHDSDFRDSIVHFWNLIFHFNIMAYLRLDNNAYISAVPLMTADGRMVAPAPQAPTQHTSHSLHQPVRRAPGLPLYRTPPGLPPRQPMGYLRTDQVQNMTPPPIGQQRRRAPIAKKHLRIRGVQQLIRKIGTPDLADGKRGGIAIWSHSTLKKRKYGFLQRVEIIDENIPETRPIKHFSNIYIWVKMKLTATMENNVLSMSNNFFYDRAKKMLITRADSLDTAVAQAALITLYSIGQFSYYDIVNNDMHKSYYLKAHHRKQRKAMYTVLHAQR